MSDGSRADGHGGRAAGRDVPPPERALEPLPPESAAPATSATTGRPPGGSVFSLEGRPTPGLYFVAWLLGGVGVALLVLGLLSARGPASAVLVVGGLLALGVALASAAGYQVVARSSRVHEAYRGPSPPLLFALVVVVVSLLTAPLALLGLLDTRAAGGFLLAVGAPALGYLLIVVFFVVRSGALSWRDMGWPLGPGRRLGDALYAAAFGLIVMLPITIVMLLFSALVAVLLGIRPPTELPRPDTSLAAVLVVLAAAFIAPLGEEVFFRGFALTAWQRDLGPRRALVRSALFFALVHILNVSATNAGEGARQALLEFVVILPVGVVLGWLFQQRGLAASIAGHMSYNGLLVLLALLVLSAQPTSA